MFGQKPFFRTCVQGNFNFLARYLVTIVQRNVRLRPPLAPSFAEAKQPPDIQSRSPGPSNTPGIPIGK